MAPGKFEWNFTHVIFKHIFVIAGWGISCEITILWMSLDLTDDKSTLVQLMAWRRQATSHYLNNVDTDLCRRTARQQAITWTMLTRISVAVPRH